MAVANYNQVYGTLPPPYVADQDGKPIHSWRTLILPFLEQGKLYEAYDFNEPWDGPNNRKLLSRRPETFAFDNAKPGSTTNYLIVVGKLTAWDPNRSTSIEELPDGASATILVVENEGSGVHWSEPRDLEFHSMDMNVASESGNGVSSWYSPPAVLTADGTVRTLSMDLSRETLRALVTAHGGEDVAVDRVTDSIANGRNRARK